MQLFAHPWDEKKRFHMKSSESTWRFHFIWSGQESSKQRQDCFHMENKSSNKIKKIKLFHLIYYINYSNNIWELRFGN
jgi:hypothetical protein